MILVVFLWFPVLLWSFALLCHALLLMLSYCVNFPTFQCFSVPFPSPVLSLSASLQLYLNHLLVCSEARASFCLCQFFSVLPLCNPPVCFSSPVKCLPVFSIVSLFCPVVCFCYFFLLFLIGCTLLLVVGTLFSLLCCYFDFWCLLFLVSVRFLIYRYFHLFVNNTHLQFLCASAFWSSPFYKAWHLGLEFMYLCTEMC